MGERRVSPRRAVFAADGAGAESILARSPGWASEAAALETIALLGGDSASRQIEDLAAFVRLEPSCWAVMRGGLARDTDAPRRYWRDVIVVDAADFAPRRFNPFRILPGDLTEWPVPGDSLPAPELPRPVSSSDDHDRLSSLQLLKRADRPPHEIESLLAALLDADNTLVLGSDWTRAELELLILLLPPRLRRELTFHTYAQPVPAGFVPRVALTPLLDERPFRPETGLWGHRLPHTSTDISAHAHELAEDLIALLGAPERLARAHDVYEQYVERHEPPRRPLAEEVETLLRFARITEARAQGAAGTALRIVARVAASDGSDATRGAGNEAERAYGFEVLRDGFDAASLGVEVAELVREGTVDPDALADIIERFLADRPSEPARADAFLRALRAACVRGGDRLTVPDLADREDVGARRIATMLMLAAAADRDRLAFASAITQAAAEPDQILRLGGFEAWVPRDEPAFATALRALTDPRPDLPRVLAALAELRHGMAAHDAIALIDAGVACVRRSHRSTPADRWEEALPVARALLDLCETVTGSGITLDGRSSSDLLTDMLDRAGAPARAVSFDGHSDAELLLGFLGAGASRGRVAGWEIEARGGALVQAIVERIRRDSRVEDGGNEGVHWGMALVERVWLGEVDSQFRSLAEQLLAASAGSAATSVLRAYDDRYPPPQLSMQPVDEASRGWSGPWADGLAGDAGGVAPGALDDRGVEAGGSSAPLILGPSRPARSSKRSTRGDARLSRIVHGDRAQVPVPRTRQRLRDSAVLARLVVGARHAGSRWRSLAARHALAVRTGAMILVAISIAAGVMLARGDGHPGTVTPVTSDASAEAAATEPPASGIAGSAVDAPVPGSVPPGEREATQRLTRESTSASAAARRAISGSLAAQPSTGGGAEGAVLPPPRGEAAAAEPSLADSRVARRLAEARARASVAEWDSVVALLSEGGPAWSEPGSFAWDSLLAQGAIHQAAGFAAGDPERRALLATARDRATLALASIAPFAPGSDLLRLLRSEACLAGDLDCDPAALREDLLLAARSPHVDVSERAARLLEALSRD